MEDEIVYTSNARIERIKGTYRLAHLPVEPDPIPFGVHAEIAEHYKTDMSKTTPHAATIDYLVAAAGG